MSIDQQIAANEKTFQEWFQRSWDAHHKESPSAADFKDVGDPRPTTRQRSYDYLDKRTVRVTADSQSRPDDFVQLLQDYLINNALLLYQDSIRIANLTGSASFYKDCGDQIGMVECHLSREGQIVTVAIGYQIYTRSISLLVNPQEIKTSRNSPEENAIAKKLIKDSKKSILCFLMEWISLSSLFAIIGLICIWVSRGLRGGISELLVFVAVCCFILSFSVVYYIFDQGFAQFIKDRHDSKGKASLHLTQDLSHTFFPVAYLSNEEVSVAQSKNKDHAAFLERIRSVVDRAVAFGESSHNQRT